MKEKIALMSYPMDNRKGKGTALYTRKLIEGLLHSPIFDYYLVHYDKVSDPLYEKTKEIIMPKVRLPYGSHFISQLLFFWKYRKTPFDIVHWFQPRVYPFYWLVPAKKIIITMHGAGDITAPKYFVFSRLIFNFVLKYLHKWVSKVIVVSEDAKLEVVKYYNFSPDKVISIYNGGGENYKQLQKTEAMKVVSSKYGISGPYILDVSRFLPHKNIVTLIKSYDQLRNKYPEHSQKLVIVGGKGSNNRDEDNAKERSIFKEDIVFVDYVDSSDLNAIYSASEIFVFPSLSEGFGLPVLEAMASGTPVITSNLASMGEIGGKAVITTNPLDINGLAEVMHNLLIDEKKKLEMVELGLNRAKEFTWAKMVEKTEKLYRDTLE
ncbi:MAG: group 1 glycosyl transferase [Parcubacteria group bacterium Gr01-1014_46]|nr:MAG: group 1 glycosyl transferase [Parcubacteria group bacterium Gr01-1014_46]